MNEMVERVAKAIFEAWAKEEAAESTWDDVCSRAALDGYPNAKKWRRMALAEAIAAIEAMREPTKEMKLGVAAADWRSTTDLNWTDGWRIMIDEALK